MNKVILAVILTGSVVAVVVFGAIAFGTSWDGRRAIRGSGRVVEDTRDVAGITSVNLATIGRLFIEIGDANTLRIEAEDNLLEHLETVVQGNKLLIRTKRDARLIPRKPVRYVLTIPYLDEIEITSSGDIEAPELKADEVTIRVGSNGDLEVSDLETEALRVIMSSSGDVSIDELVADTLEVDISSNGNLAISGGEVNSQKISIGSSGNYSAPDLASDEAEVRLSSNGSATIWVTDALNAMLNSSGDLRYRGNPTMDVTTNSSGQVTQIGE